MKETQWLIQWLTLRASSEATVNVNLNISFKDQETCIITINMYCKQIISCLDLNND